MIYYAAIISKHHEHFVCGEYFNTFEEARKYIPASNDCGYYGIITCYENGREIEKHYYRG